MDNGREMTPDELRVANNRLRAENERLKSLLTEARENVDLDVRELEAMYAGYPAIMDRKTAADRYLRGRIDAALADYDPCASKDHGEAASP